MMHNPFQSYQTDPTLGVYAGIANPFSVPYPTMQTSPTNPAALNPLASALGLSCATSGIGQTGYAGIPNYGNINPQQLASLLTSQLTSQSGIPQGFGQSPLWQNPQATSVFQNPWITGGLQNPLVTAGLQNPLVAAGLQNQLLAGLQNPLLNPLVAQQQFAAPLGAQFGLQPLQLAAYQQFGQGLPYGQQGLPYGQQGSPYAQLGSPFVQYGSPYGQIGVPQQGYQQQHQPYPQQIGLGQVFGQQGSPYTSQGLPYGQIGSPLAPQSWVGQAGPFGANHPFGQIHPLLAQQLAQQLGARPFQIPGISSWAGF